MAVATADKGEWEVLIYPHIRPDEKGQLKEYDPESAFAAAMAANDAIRLPAGRGEYGDPEITAAEARAQQLTEGFSKYLGSRGSEGAPPKAEPKAEEPDYTTDFADYLDPELLKTLQESAKADKPPLNEVLGTIAMAFANPEMAQTMIKNRGVKAENAKALLAQLQQQAFQYDQSRRHQDQQAKHQDERIRIEEAKIDAQNERAALTASNQRFNEYYQLSGGVFGNPAPIRAKNESTQEFIARRDQWFNEELPHMVQLQRSAMQGASKAKVYEQFFQMAAKGGLDGSTLKGLYRAALSNEFAPNGTPLFNDQELNGLTDTIGATLADMAQSQTNKQNANIRNLDARGRLSDERAKGVQSAMQKAIEDVENDPSHQAILRLDKQLIGHAREMDSYMDEYEATRKEFDAEREAIASGLADTSTGYEYLQGLETRLYELKMQMQTTANQAATAKNLLLAHEDILQVESLAESTFIDAASSTSKAFPGKGADAIWQAIMTPGPDPTGIKEFFWSDLQAQLVSRTGKPKNWLMSGDEFLERAISKQVLMSADVPQPYTDPQLNLLTSEEEMKFGEAGVQAGVKMKPSPDTITTPGKPTGIGRWGLAFNRWLKNLGGGDAAAYERQGGQ